MSREQIGMRVLDRDGAMDWYKDGTIGFVGANGKQKRVKAENIKALDLSSLPHELMMDIIESVKP